MANHIEKIKKEVTVVRVEAQKQPIRTKQDVSIPDFIKYGAFM